MTHNEQQSDAGWFERLSDREHVRLRPGMYIGNIDNDGLHHLANELINNSVDEVLAGYATQISVTIHRDGSLTVEDDGRGIPVDRHEEESSRQERDVTALEVVMTQLRMSVRSNGQTYKTSNGRHGIGLKAINFLSRWCEVGVCRNGFEHVLKFQDGSVVGDLEKSKPTSHCGTRITFQPDSDILTTTDFDFVRLQSRLRELAMLHPSLKTRIHDERTREFHFARGIREIAEELSLGQWGCSPILYFEAEGCAAQIEVAFGFTLQFGRKIRLYVNDVLASQGGTPVAGLLSGITRAMHAEANSQGWKNMSSLCDEFSQRIAAVIAVRHPEPSFAGACRERLANPELKEIVESAAYESLLKHFKSEPDFAIQQWAMAKKAVERRAEQNESNYEYYDEDIED